MGLLGQRAVAHGRCLEALDDGVNALDLVEGHALLGIVEVQQAAQVHRVAVLIGSGGGVLFEGIVIAGPAGLLQKVDGLRVVEVLLGSGAAAEFVRTQARQLAVDVQTQRVECFLMAGFQIILDVLDRDAAHAGDGVRKVFVDDLFRDAQRLKDLAARVGLDRGNAHLGRDFDNARQHGLVVVADSGVVVLVEKAVGNQLTDSLLRQIRVDSSCAVAQQRGEVVYQARLAAFQNQRHGGALAGADQILADRAHSQQAGNGDVVLVNVTVRQNQDVRAVAVGAVHIDKQALNGLFQVGVLVVADGQRHDLEAGHVHGLDLEQIGLGQDRVLDFQDLAVVGVLLQKIALRTDVDGGRGDDLLAQRVDGRVRDLRKHLLEILAQIRAGVAQNGQRSIVAHGPGGLAAVLGHRQNDRGDVLIPVAERLLQLDKLFFRVAGHLLVGHLQAGQRDEVAVQPLAVGLAAGVVGLQLFVVDQLAPDGVDQQHLAGAQTVLAHDLVSGNVEHADLAGKDQAAILRDVVAARAQTVAVQHCAHHVAVAEQDAGGAVPRLQHRGIVLVEVALLRVHRLVVVPRLGDRDHDGQRQIHAVHDHEFQRVIQLGRVGAALVDDGQDLRHIVL